MSLFSTENFLYPKKLLLLVNLNHENETVSFIMIRVNLKSLSGPLSLPNKVIVDLDTIQITCTLSNFTTVIFNTFVIV